ncbi:hypothetical protein [Spiroplasma turonicum]|uniref:Uncharacterized protein n=1 Tax=Spiroplasma turonicum TaxID=216946 RepID=A0A0K1P7T1_9MOLU|nr:hypothetical protein [Spiroplasma turonicum]AKU79942.1 hypothetical protein STURON_00696 [Spiroplasma turonicum]ALX70955.1 hypothetical protein STURO_v1c06960 [Spiroplasma turonicum]
MLNIQILNEKQIDFYNFSIKNIKIFEKFSLKEIAKKFGCGISFIYKYFEILGISGIKEYIVCINLIISKKENLKELLVNNNGGFLDDELSYYFIEQMNQVDIIKKQTRSINNFKNYLRQSRKVYGIAFGHSKLAIQDFLGFYSYINKNCEFLNCDSKIDFKNYIEKKSLIIIYSIRFANKKLFKILDILNKLQDVKLLLVTSNKLIDYKYGLNEIIYIDNVMKNIDNININYYIGPLNSFILLNNFLKAELFEDNKSILMKNKSFLKETIGWKNYKEIENIK